MKKLISIMFFATMALLSFAINPISDFKYTLSDDRNGVVITKYIGKSKVIEFPSEIEGFPVTQIGETWYSSWIVDVGVWKNTIFEKVIIPNSVTVVYLDNIKIKKLSIPDSVKTIVLNNIEYLEELILPKQVNNEVSISLGGFCNLEEICVPTSTNSDYSVSINTTFTSKYSTTKPDRVKKITIPNGVKTISFNGNFKNVGEINIPESTELITGRVLVAPTTKFIFQNEKKQIKFYYTSFSHFEQFVIFISENCSLKENKDIQDLWRNHGYRGEFYEENSFY